MLRAASSSVQATAGSLRSLRALSASPARLRAVRHSTSAAAGAAPPLPRASRPAFCGVRRPRASASAATRRAVGVEHPRPSLVAPEQLQRAHHTQPQQPGAQQQPQQQQPAPLAMAPLAPLPSLHHPATVPLSLDGGVVRDAAGNVLLEGVSPHVCLNPAASQHGALVLGASNARGPAASWDLTVGRLRFKRFLACARNKLWWMTPEWGASLDQLPPETQFLLLQLADEQPAPGGAAAAGGGSGERFALVLPLIDGDFRATCRPNRSWTHRQGALVIRVESGDADTKSESCDSVLLLACSTDPFHLVDAGVAAAAALSGGAAPRAAKHLPSSLDGFGWCTWDAFYSTVSARGLVEGLGSLAAGGVTPRLLIIDDGWQLTDVDPPYGKAPTAQLADKLAGEGRAAAALENTREMLLETQDTFYEQNAKLLAEASTQMQQEVRNLFPTVANTGVISHHHAPPAASWDAPAEAAAAAKEQELEVRRSRDAGDAGADGAAAPGRSPGAGAGPRQRGAGGAAGPSAVSWAQQEADEEEALLPDWAEKRRQAAKRQQQPGGGQKQGLDLPSLAELRPPKAEGRLKAAAAEAEGKIKEAAAEAEGAMLRALAKAAPTPRQQFILIRWAQAAAGALVGVATAAFLLFYQWVLEPAPPHSLRVKAFAALTQGVLRGAMLTFFASASDFTRRLTSVEANAKFSRLDAGPEEDWEATQADLRSVVAHIKQRFGVRHVYCWHGLPAYWGGVMPDSPALAGVTSAQLVFPRPTASIAEVEPSLLWSPAVLAGVGIAENPGALYQAMHSYLAASCVDGVKVDCQAGVGLVGSAGLGGGPAAARRFQAALEDSIAVNFPGNHAINCMCHSSENFYRFSRTAVARVSDDYYPRDPASSTPHIGACAFNSLYLGALVQPDWDMFQSAHPAGVLHGMARAVSGGAVYVSDKPGQHDFTLLCRLVLPDGTILRAALPGRPTRDCLFADVLRDNATLLKVWNVNAVVGIIGVFNLQGASWDRSRRKFHIHSRRAPRLATTVGPHDVEPFRWLGAAPPRAADGDGDGDGDGRGGGRWAGAAVAAGVDAAAGAGEQQAQTQPQAQQQQQQQQQQPQQFAVYRYGTEELQLCTGGGGGVAVELDQAGSDLVWVSPLLTCASAGVSFAPLGLVDMFNGGGAVLSCRLEAASAAASAAGAAAGVGAGSRGGAVVAAAAALPGGGAAGGPAAVGTLQLRGCGRFLAFSSQRPRLVLLNLAPHNFSWDEYTQRLEFEVPQFEELRCEVEVLYG